MEWKGKKCNLTRFCCNNLADKSEEKGKKLKNWGDIIYGCPLITVTSLGIHLFCNVWKHVSFCKSVADQP